MLKRNSNFTLIELIVVIVVLGILAAIVIPNISSFAKQAREAQYTADLRNIQTGFDMESANSDDLVSGLVIGAGETGIFPVSETYDAEKEAYVPFTVEEKTTAADGSVTKTEVPAEFKLVDVGAMVPDELRKLPKYVVPVDNDGAKFNTVETAFAEIEKDPKKKTVVVAVQVDGEGKSKAVLNYIGLKEDSTDKYVVR